MVEKACTVPSSAIRMQKIRRWNRTFKNAERWRGASLRKCGTTDQQVLSVCSC